MATIVYNKLVRDLIPELIVSTGKTCRTSVLTEKEYLNALDRKLDEELREYHESRQLEELADLMEVVYASAEALGFSQEELEAVRGKKKAARGGFSERIFLESVSDDQ